MLDNCTVDISWEISDDNGAPVDYYQLEYQVGPSEPVHANITLLGDRH